ncbi:protein tyrosine phosphatase, partial [Methylopila musalis]
PRPGYAAPERAHVAAALAFAGRDARPLIVQCYAGVSRSPAMAYALACAAWPDRDEAALAAELRRLSPSATPNPRIVALADDLLGRDGRMRAAIAALGRGAEAYEGEMFAWSLGDAADAEGLRP